MTIIIGAVTADGVIGRDGTLPWRHPSDMKHFMSTTMGYPIVVGRLTYESFPRRPLPGRLNVVLTRRSDYNVAEGAVVVANYDQARRCCKETGADRMFVCGGAQIYRLALSDADEMALTEIPDREEGDAFFPKWSVADWEEIDSRDGDGGLRWKYYRRRHPTE